MARMTKIAMPAKTHRPYLVIVSINPKGVVSMLVLTNSMPSNSSHLSSNIRSGSESFVVYLGRHRASRREVPLYRRFRAV